MGMRSIDVRIVSSALGLLCIFSAGCGGPEAPKPVDKPPSVEQPLPKPVVLSDPVAEHWTETGEQALVGKKCTTWWEAPLSADVLMQTIRRSVLSVWPDSGYSQSGGGEGRYRIPVATDVFGGGRWSEIVIRTEQAASDTTRLTFNANLSAEDQADAASVLKKEASRLYAVTSQSGVRTETVPVSVPPVKPPHYQISSKRSKPQWRNGRPDYGFPDSLLNVVVAPLDGCRYGNPFTSKPDRNVSLSDYSTLPSGTFVSRWAIEVDYLKEFTPDPLTQLFMMGDDMRKLDIKMTVGPEIVQIEKSEVLDSTKKPWRLYRTFSFPERCDILKAVNSSSTKDETPLNLIVVIHGWNPPDKSLAARGRPFVSRFDTYEWAALLRRIQAPGRLPPEWGLVKYDWSADAATGPALVSGEKEIVDGWRNASEAAVIGYLHGHHMGELLRQQYPDLKKIHFIAHSAGAWVAYSATKYLLTNMPKILVQVTLLDPFMPAEDRHFPYPPLGVAQMKSLRQTAGNERICRLENYFAPDVTGESTEQRFATSMGAFGWDTTVMYDSAHRQPIPRDIERDVSMGVRETYPGAHPERIYGSHSGPIIFYAESIDGTTREKSLTELGWNLSMIHQEGN